MPLFFALIRFVALASAYQVTSPNRAVRWTTADPNVVTWERVSTDPLNFTLVLSYQPLVLSNQAQTSSYHQVLAAFVDGTFGNVTVAPPSMGYPTGNGFQVKFVQDTEHLSTIYAQSGRFSIDTSTSINIVRQEGGGDGGGEGGDEGGGGDDEPDFEPPDIDPPDIDPPDIDPPDIDPPDIDPPDSDPDPDFGDPSGSSNSSNLNNADRITAAGSAGLIFGALAAMVL